MPLQAICNMDSVDLPKTEAPKAAGRGQALVPNWLGRPGSPQTGLLKQLMSVQADGKRGASCSRGL